MFIKITKNSAGHSYYHLVESYRDNGKVKQRTLLSLGRVEEGNLEKLAHAVAQHTELLSILDIVKSVSVDQTFVLGPLLILEKLFEQLSIKKVLIKIAQAHPRIGFDFVKIIFSLVVTRFMRPSSKLNVFDEQLGQLYPEMFEHTIELHQIYRALDLLQQHKEDIEKELYWHDRNLFNASVDVVLYDLTTLRFESTRTDLGELRQFGFSKEMRTDCTQVVLGLLVDTEGMPLGFEVYPGNTFEGKTLSSIVEKMRNKFKVRRFIFVGDRGLFSKTNLEKLKEEQGEFIVGMRLDHATEMEQMSFFDKNLFTSINKKLMYYDTTWRTDRCIVTWSQDRAERDKKVRDNIIEKIKKKLSKKKIKTKEFVSNQNYRRFVKGLDANEQPALNEDAIKEAATRDGFFAILTNVADKKACELVAQYKELWKIEDAFGELKGTLKARPVFHWTDERIVGHLTMCFIAQVCEAAMTKALRKSTDILNSLSVQQEIIDERPLTAALSMHEVGNIRAIPVQIKNKKIWVRTDISGHAAKLFKALGIRIPPKLLKAVDLENENVVAQNKTASITA